MIQPSASWRETCLGDHVDLLTGHPFKSAKFTDAKDDVRLLRGDNVAQGYLRWDGVKCWDANEYSDYADFQLQEGDVILAMDRPWITAGLKYAWMRRSDLPALLVQRVARMRGINGLLTDYVRCLIGSKDFTDHVQSITTGVNVPHISSRDIKAFRFLLPPTEYQEKIASIITTHDDLIENNTHRIAVLEEMARRLHQNWFSHFRYSGGERCDQSGDLPQGWRMARLDAVASVNPESITPRNAPETIRYIDIASVSPGKVNEAQLIRFEDAPSRARRRVQSGDIIWSCVRPNRRSYALIINPPSNMIASTGFAVLRANAVPYSYLHHAVTTDSFVDYLVNHATGAAYPAVTQTVFETAQILVPPDDLLTRFDDIAEPILRQANILHGKNANLLAQRDLLLPKLISGEINLSEAIQRTEDIAA